MEASIHWSPHRTREVGRYVIADNTKSSLTLYSADAFEEHEVRSLVIAQFNKLPNFAAFAWSPVHENLVALGLTSGNAQLIRLGDERSKSVTVATFTAKQQRKCTTVALNAQDLLAVGLEKNRSDAGLSIYDTNLGLNGESSEPVKRLCLAETVFGACFFKNQPQELVATTQRAIRIYDIREDYMAGNSRTVQVNTKCVHNVVIDPLNENYLASSGGHGDPSYAIWDRRWMTQQSFPGGGNGAVLNCTMSSAAGEAVTIRSLRWSGSTQGRLAISSTAGSVKVVDIRQSMSMTGVLDQSQAPLNPYGGSLWRANQYIPLSRTVISTQLSAESIDRTNLISFDWVPGSAGEGTQRMIVLNGMHEVATLKVSNVCTEAHISGRHTMLVSAKALSISDQPGTVIDEVDPKAKPNVSSLPQLLADSSVAMNRCRRGYLFDCDKNIGIVAADTRLVRLWRIIRRFQAQARDDGMLCGTLDLSYIGVAAIWTEGVRYGGRRYTQGDPVSVAEAITGLISSRTVPQFEGARTGFPEHRQLCLALCGWKFTIETLEEECQELIEDGQYYLAIVQAVLHGYKHIALNLLRSLIRSKTIPNIGLGALLASNEINEEQHEMCLWMEADAEDPALKALLTYLTTGDWRTVMKTTYLDSDYRIALGLKYLNDTELSGFLQGETARAIRNGDLEGILLTGLTEPAMDLLQTYVTKTGDVQTAVLTSAYANPRYVDDMRWDAWKQTYFEQMQIWRAFSERARFTVEHNAMSLNRDGRSYKQGPAQQMRLLCKHCRAPLGGNTIHHSSIVSSKGSTGGSTVSAAGTGATVCLQCGRHLPRCSLCGLWLGASQSFDQLGKSDDGCTIDRVDPGLSGFVTFCVRCEHAYHANHANQWFEKHKVCAVPGCDCRCLAT